MALVVVEKLDLCVDPLAVCCLNGGRLESPSNGGASRCVLDMLSPSGIWWVCLVKVMRKI